MNNLSTKKNDHFNDSYFLSMTSLSSRGSPMFIDFYFSENFSRENLVPLYFDSKIYLTQPY